MENETQAQILTQLGCDLGQGYLWCRARPEAEIRQWLATAGAMLAPAAKSRPVGKAELD